VARWSQSCWTMGTRKDYLEPRKGVRCRPSVVVMTFLLGRGAACLQSETTRLKHSSIFRIGILNLLVLGGCSIALQKTRQVPRIPSNNVYPTSLLS
jgi:hypothetical protein